MKDKITLAIVSWAVIPLLSAIAFFLLLCHFANGTNLENFDWSAVATNVMRATNSIAPSPLTNMAGTNAIATNSITVNSPSPTPVARANGQNSTTKDTTGPDRLTKELNVRMLWSISALGFAFLCLLIVFYSIQLVSDALQLEVCGRSTCVAIAIGVYAILFLLSRGPIPTIAGGTAADQLLEVMQNYSSTTKGVSLNESIRDKHADTLASIQNLVALLSTGAKMAVVFVAIAGCCILMVMRQEQDLFENIAAPSSDDISRAKDKYEERVNATIGLLQITACCLVGAVIEVFLLYTMASYYVMPILQANVQYFAQSLAIVCGLVYSGLLIAIYLPLIAGQKTIGNKLLKSHGGNAVTGQDTVFLAQLDDVNPKKAPMVNTIITIFAPVLVAFLTQLASMLSSSFLK